MDAIALREAVSQFLALEAMLLDEGRFEEWYELLDADLVYEAPLRLAANARADEVVAGAYRFRDDKKVIRTRIDRLATGNAHSESPPSRTVRSVSSICVLPGDDTGTVRVSSALIVYRHRGNDPHGDTIHARRQDRLRMTDRGLRLVSRTILLSEVALSTPNLAIFL